MGCPSVRGSTFLKKKRIAPMGFKVYFSTDKQKRVLIACMQTHTHIMLLRYSFMVNVSLIQAFLIGQDVIGTAAN
jgi:hypothetical protein